MDDAGLRDARRRSARSCRSSSCTATPTSSSTRTRCGAWGLDYFDDAARGPAPVDIVRFLGSIDLVALNERGWLARPRRELCESLPRTATAAGVSEPDVPTSAQPAVVRRHKAATPPTSREAFLASSEELMRPIREARLKGAVASMRAFGEIVRRDRPEIPDGYFRVVRAGALEMGIGSAALPKLLIRLAGPSDDPADDVLLEAKAVRPLGSDTCLEQPASTPTPTFRIVQGSKQVGRLKHTILVAGPDHAIAEMAVEGKHLSDWWIRSWDPTYHEIALDDLQSVADLADLAYDAGVQLGAGAVAAENAENATLRRQLAASIDQAEPRLRRDAEQLVDELLRGWRGLEKPVRRPRRIVRRRVAGVHDDAPQGTQHEDSTHDHTPCHRCSPGRHSGSPLARRHHVPSRSSPFRIEMWWGRTSRLHPQRGLSQP